MTPNVVAVVPASLKFGWDLPKNPKSTTSLFTYTLNLSGPHLVWFPSHVPVGLKTKLTTASFLCDGKSKVFVGCWLIAKGPKTLEPLTELLTVEKLVQPSALPSSKSSDASRWQELESGVGGRVGNSVGEDVVGAVGILVGVLVVGTAVGIDVGTPLGYLVGVLVGAAVGDVVGLSVGEAVGAEVGA